MLLAWACRLTCTPSATRPGTGGQNSNSSDPRCGALRAYDGEADVLVSFVCCQILGCIHVVVSVDADVEMLDAREYEHHSFVEGRVGEPT